MNHRGIAAITVRDTRGCSSARRPPSVPACLIALVVVRAALRSLGFARTLRAIDRLTSRRASGQQVRADDLRAADRAVAVAAALFPGRALCLEQSLVLYYVLHRRGIGVVLRIGVHPYPFTAHAWVEWDGVPVNDVVEHTRTYARIDDVGNLP